MPINPSLEIQLQRGNETIDNAHIVPKEILLRARDQAFVVIYGLTALPPSEVEIALSQRNLAISQAALDFIKSP